MKDTALTFKEAVKDALRESMAGDKRVFLMGCGVSSPSEIFGSTTGLLKEFGRRRIIETPVAENGMAGVAVGAALSGMHPVLVYQRIDFALLAMDQIVNHAAKWRYMSAGKLSVPLTVRGIIGRGWGQGAQHAQSLQATFSHIPGLKVVMPSNPYDAKGLLASSIRENNPVVFLEMRSLYEMKGRVPRRHYSIPLGKGRVVRRGRDITAVAFSSAVQEAEQAALRLKEEGIEMEIIDPRCLRPLDSGLILRSLKKTGRLLIIDTGWKVYGVSAEIAALAAESGLRFLKAPVRRICLADAPAPASVYLEKVYYPGARDIVREARGLMRRG